MLRWFFRLKLDAEEKKLGASMDYLRHIVDVAPTAFLRFASIMPFANSRKVLSADTRFVAQIVALQQEDCSPCLQIGVNLAKQSGVEPALIQAALNGQGDAMSQELVDVHEFTKSVIAAEDDVERREKIRQRYGERGLSELAYAIASCRVPPTVKRVLGYAQSCRVVTVDV